MKQTNVLMSKQHGFTLIELVVRAAIAGILGIGLLMATAMTFNTNSSVTNEQLTISQVQNACHYLSQDIQQSQAATQSLSSGTTLSLIVPISTEGVTFADQTIAYSVSHQNLTRTVNGGQAFVVAKDITNFVVNTSGSVPTITVSATVTGAKTTTQTRIIP